MSLDDALKVSHQHRQKCFGFLAQLVENVPEPGAIKADLEKQKTEKDFSKRWKEWKAKLQKADLAYVNIDVGAWNDKIQEAIKARTELGNKNAALKQSLDAAEGEIKSIRSSPKWAGYKRLGIDVVIDALAAVLQEQRKLLNNAMEEFNDAGEDINSQKKMAGILSERAIFHHKQAAKATDELLANDNFKTVQAAKKK
jgi:hypothetical protein